MTLPSLLTWAAAWAAALATVAYQRALLPLALLLIAEHQQGFLPPQELNQPHPPSERAAGARAEIITLRPVTRQSLATLTCRQLRIMARTSRHLPKQHLIDMVLSQDAFVS